MAEDVQTPEGDFDDQFVLDDASLDDISLDDDALFADLDSEIRLNGAADSAEEAAPLEIDGLSAAAEAGGDIDLGDLDLEGLADAPVSEPVELDDLLGGDAGGADGLDDLLGGDAGGADGLDDLLGGDAGGADGLDDLLGGDAGGAGGLDDLLGGDAGGAGGLDDLALDDGSGGAGGLDDLALDDGSGGAGGLDDLALDDGSGGADGLDDLAQDPEPEEPPPLDAEAGGESDALEGLEELMAGTGESLDDLIPEEPELDPGAVDLPLPDGGDLDLGSMDAGNGEPVLEEMGLDATLDAQLDDLIPADTEIGEDALDAEFDDLIPPETGAEEKTTGAMDLNAFADEISLEDLGEVVAETTGGKEDDGLDFELGNEEFSMDSLDDGMELPPLDLGAAAPVISSIDIGAGEEGEETPFQAHPDLDLSDADLEFDIAEVENGGDELSATEPDFGEEHSLDDLSLDAELPGLEPAIMDAPEGEEDFDSAPFTAVEDVDLAAAGVLDLNLDNVDTQQGEFSNYRPPGADEILDVPVGQEPGRTASPSPVPAPRGQDGISDDLLLSIPHQVNVEMGSIALKGREIMDLSYGSVVPLNRTVGEPVELVLEGKSIAQGEIVLINGKNLGVRIVAVHK